MKKTTQKILVVFLMALVLFNFPVLSIFNQPSLWGGVPVAVIYIFIAWFLVIFALWRVFKQKT
ncbi:MAG: hypothetical protein ACK40K_01250 [Raineya sp.]